jgi:hypothetical protein
VIRLLRAGTLRTPQKGDAINSNNVGHRRRSLRTLFGSACQSPHSRLHEKLVPARTSRLAGSDHFRSRLATTRELGPSVNTSPSGESHYFAI